MSRTELDAVVIGPLLEIRVSVRNAGRDRCEALPESSLYAVEANKVFLT